MLIQRKLFHQIQPYLESKQAIIVTGMRRTGKTSLLAYIYEQIPSKNKLSLDLENPINQKYFEEKNYETIKSSLEFLGLDFSKQAYLFLDEIQWSPKLPSVIKYLLDHYGLKFFLTGSASFYLKNLFTESLAGRKYLFELFPLDFKEFLLFKKSSLELPKDPSKIDEAIFETVFPLYKEYLYFGGFPEVILKPTHEEKKKALEDIFTSYYQLEVLQLGDFRKNHVLRDLILLLMQRIGSKIDYSKLSQELHISRPTVMEYLSFLEATYLISFVKPFSKSRDIEIKKSPKVYLCDSGLAHHHAQISEGSLFENNVFQCLRIRGKLNYYQRKSGHEIDFILNQEIGFEAKLTPSQSQLNQLIELGAEIDLKEVKLVSLNPAFHLRPANKTTYGFLI